MPCADLRIRTTRARTQAHARTHASPVTCYGYTATTLVAPTKVYELLLPSVLLLFTRSFHYYVKLLLHYNILSSKSSITLNLLCNAERH